MAKKIKKTTNHLPWYGALHFMRIGPNDLWGRPVPPSQTTLKRWSDRVREELFTLERDGAPKRSLQQEAVAFLDGDDVVIGGADRERVRLKAADRDTWSMAPWMC